MTKIRQRDLFQQNILLRNNSKKIVTSFNMDRDTPSPVHPSQITLKRLNATPKTIKEIFGFLKAQPHDHYQTWGYGEPKIEKVTAMLRSNSIFAILLGGSQLVGIVGFLYKITYYNPLYNGQYWINYIVDKRYTKQGIATTAVGQLLDVIREFTPIKRLYAGIYASNLSSIRVVEKHGFVQRKQRDKRESLVFEKVIE